VWSLLSELSGPELSGSFGATRRDEPLGTHQLSRAFASECIGRHSRCFSPAFAGRSTQTTIKEHWPDPLRPQVSRTRQDRPAPPDQGRGFSCAPHSRGRESELFIFAKHEGSVVIDGHDLRAAAAVAGLPYRRVGVHGEVATFVSLEDLTHAVADHGQSFTCGG
jgi:hypothetical protein